LFIGWLIARSYNKSKFKEHELEAKAKAEVIKNEADKLLQSAKSNATT